MKKSRRLIRNTLLALNGAMVLYLGANRLYAVDEAPAALRQATTAAQLASLADFNEVRVTGALVVEIVQQPTHSVEYTPASGGPGELFANVHEHALLLNGEETLPGGRVRIGMPALTKLMLNGGTKMSVTGFDGGNVRVILGEVEPLVLRDNRVRRWDIVAGEGREVHFDHATIAAGKVELSGRGTITVTD